MEIRLKEGDGLRCEVSGSDEKALIKLQTDSGETPWMGMQALKKAYRILAPIVGESQPLDKPKPVTRQDRNDMPILVQNEPVFEAPSLPPQPSSSGAGKKLSASDVQNLTVFQSELVKLIQDPPPMNDSTSADGLSEAHVRRLISDHQGRFQDPIALYPILQRHLGMQRARFDQIIEMNQKQRYSL